MTLAQLAGSDLSISLLSRIERGQVRPSLGTLETIARRLGVRPAELLDAGALDASGSGRRALVEASLAAGDFLGALEQIESVGVADGGSGQTHDREDALLLAEALAGLGRDADAAAALAPITADPSPRGQDHLQARALLLDAALRERRGETDAAQDGFGRAFGLLPRGDHDRRADALLGLARLAEAASGSTTARVLYRQVLEELTAAASSARRRSALLASARAAAASGDDVLARAQATAAAELGRLERAATLRGDVAARLAALERPTRVSDAPARYYRDAGDALIQRSVSHPRDE